MKCKICNRESSKNGYCELHMRAYESIVKKYDSWRKALDVSWKEYLSKIAENPITGEWAKEVAEHLLKSGGNRDGAKD